MQNWPIPRPTFKLAPTTPNLKLWCICHPGVNQTLTLFVYFADVAFYLMWQGDETATTTSPTCNSGCLPQEHHGHQSTTLQLRLPGNPCNVKKGEDNKNNDGCFSYVLIPIPSKDLSLDMSFATNAKALRLHFYLQPGLSVLAGAALLKSVMDKNPMMSPGSGSG
ncbi:hypothetical protein Hanom_Chr06g00520341 [Helianthus anomalus]